MDETTDDEIVEEIKEETIGVKQAPPPEPPKPSSFDMPREDTTTTSHEPVSIKFNDIDFAQDIEGAEHQIPAPKTLERLEEISEMRAQQRKQEEEQEQDDEDNVKLKIFDEPIKLNDLEVFDMNPQEPVNLEELNLDLISLD